MPVKHLRNVLNALPCLFLVQINQQKAVWIHDHSQQACRASFLYQPLGDENYGPQDSRLILLNGVILRNSTFIFFCGLHVNIFYVKYLIQVITK